MLNDYIYSNVDSKDDFQLKTAEMMLLMADRFMSLLQTKDGPSNPQS